MKKALIIAIPLILLSILTYPGSSPAVEVTALVPHIEVLTPGVTRNFTITQHYNFPQDFSPFIVFLIGYGPFKISLSKDDTVGDLLALSGLGISPAGIIPFIKFGRSDVALEVSIEIGNERYPYGLVMFSSWISQPPPEPGNTYDVTLKF